MAVSIVPSATGIGTEDARTCAALVDDLLAYVGATGDTAKSRARSALRQAVQHFNLSKLWVDRYLTADVTLADATRAYALPARWAGDVGIGFLLNTTGDNELPVEYKTHPEFLYATQSSNVSSDGDPYLFTIRNRVNSGELEVFPTPTTTTIATHPTLRLHYYADITICAQDADSLSVSAPLEAAIFDHALWRLNEMIGDKERYGFYRSLARESFMAAFTYDNRMRLEILAPRQRMRR